MLGLRRTAFCLSDAVIAAVERRGEFVEKEHKIDLIRWTSRGTGDFRLFLDINATFSLYPRIDVARWTQLDAAWAGCEMSPA